MSDYGKSVEEDARAIAAKIGTPDFVYRPVDIHRGHKGNSELSDGLLMSWDAGLIAQVKAREPSSAIGDDDESAKRWCEKHAAKAVRQGVGTRRNLLAYKEIVKAESYRGHFRDLPEADEWPIVVIIDHPRSAGIDLPIHPNCMYITLADWGALYSMIRSTYGVIQYVSRVIKEGLHVPLDRELDRYAALANADVESIVTVNGLPVLPVRPMTEQENGHIGLFEHLIMRIGTAQDGTGWDEVSHLRVIDMLDQVPILLRAAYGEKIAKNIRESVRMKRRLSFVARDLYRANIHIAVMTDVDLGQHGPDGQEFNGYLGSYAALRHVESIEAGVSTDLSTLAIGVLHNPAKGFRYSYVALGEADISIPADARQELEREFGRFDGRTVRPVEQHKHGYLSIEIT